MDTYVDNERHRTAMQPPPALRVRAAPRHPRRCSSSTCPWHAFVVTPCIPHGGAPNAPEPVIGIGSKPVYYCSSEDGKKHTFNVKAYLATTELDPTHVKTDEDDCLIHAHFEKDFGDDAAPTVQEANDYWDWIFGIAQYDPDKTSRSGTPTTRTNCIAYAFSQVATAGPQTPYYEHWLDMDAEKAFTDDVDTVGKYEVTAGDIIQYNYYDTIYQEDRLVHVSVVISTEAAQGGGARPSSIKWKWAQSAIYSYDTQEGYAWDTPYNTCLDPATPLDEQDGEWNERAPHYTAARTNVYTPD